MNIFDEGRALASFDNWDGFSGDAVSSESFTTAEALIRYYDLENKLTRKDISYYPNGSIGIEWTVVHGIAELVVKDKEYTLSIYNGSLEVMSRKGSV